MQQIMVRAETTISLQPLVMQAIIKQVKTLAHGIKRTLEELTRFEHLYGMKSAEFEARFHKGELSETKDFIDWWMELEALHLLESKYQALQGVQIG